MVVLAQCGRDTDLHYEQIVKHRASLEPDVIIYQWFDNDLELGDRRYSLPKKERLWHRLVFNRRLLERSYFWFFVDHQIKLRFPEQSRSYEDYLLERFEEDTSDWRKFVHCFQEWFREARKLTPRVIVVLYPSLASPQGYRFAVLGKKVAQLCRETGVEVLDLGVSLGGLQGNTRAVRVSRYDGHPNPTVHKRIAKAIYHERPVYWPEMQQVGKGGNADGDKCKARCSVTCPTEINIMRRGWCCFADEFE
jgi:hypothetical protein